MPLFIFINTLSEVKVNELALTEDCVMTHPLMFSNTFLLMVLL
jgi:hypothetical protein